MNKAIKNLREAWVNNFHNRKATLKAMLESDT